MCGLQQRPQTQSYAVSNNLFRHISSAYPASAHVLGRQEDLDVDNGLPHQARRQLLHAVCKLVAKATRKLDMRQHCARARQEHM